MKPRIRLHVKAQRRLRILANYLAKLPPKAEKHFDLNRFFWMRSGIVYGTVINRAIIMKNCGTTACALGWAATIPSFQSLGLELVVITSSTYFRFAKTSFKLNGQSYNPFIIAQKFFDLDENQALLIFGAGDSDYLSLKKYVKLLRKYLKHKGTSPSGRLGNIETLEEYSAAWEPV